MLDDRREITEGEILMLIDCYMNNKCKDEEYEDGVVCFKSHIQEGKIIEIGDSKRYSGTDKNVLPSKKAAEQHLALMQLHQLRDCYRNGWKPKSSSSVYSIENIIAQMEARRKEIGNRATKQ